MFELRIDFCTHFIRLHALPGHMEISETEDKNGSVQTENGKKELANVEFVCSL